MEQTNHAALGFGQHARGALHADPTALGDTAGEHRPTLREGIDAALARTDGTERRAVIEERASIPFAVPAVALESPPNARRDAAPAAYRGYTGTRFGDRGERVDRGDDEPPQPDTFTAARGTDLVHAVIPIAVADERQVMRAEGETHVDRPYAVIKQACARTDFGREIAAGDTAPRPLTAVANVRPFSPGPSERSQTKTKFREASLRSNRPHPQN